MSEGAGSARSTVLVVDDESTGRLILKAQLERENYHVVTAADGLEAIKRFEQKIPDIVFLDVMLPDICGHEVARVMKQGAGEHFVPIIFLTGLSEEDALAECVAAGGDDFLSKPVKFSTLRSKMKAIERIRDLYERGRLQRLELAALHERMEFEQQVAERILSGAVMARNVAVPPIRSWLKPATTFNGDLFISAYTPSGGVSVLMGDFTGHGLEAALGAMPTAEAFRAMTAKGFSLAEVLAEINQSLSRILPTGMFLAACALRIEADLKTAMVWNSGLPDVYLCRGEDSPRRFASMHPPLGVLPSFLPGCQPELVMLAPGDVFVLCSDGVIEACDAHGVSFGEDRLAALLNSLAPPEIFDGVRDSVQAFVAGTGQRDDISLAVIPCEAALLQGARIEDDRRIPHPHGMPAEPWNWGLRLEGSNLRLIDPVPLMMGQLTAFGISSRHRQQLYMVVTELFSNALEHGVLGLDSALKASAEGFMRYYAQRQQGLQALTHGFIDLRLDYRLEAGQGLIRVCVEDSGAGLAGAGRRLLSASAAPHAYCGRGLSLLQLLCHELRFPGPGNRVEADYLL